MILDRCANGEAIRSAIKNGEVFTGESIIKTDQGPVRVSLSYDPPSKSLEISVSGTTYQRRTLSFSCNQLGLPTDMEMTVFQEDSSANPFYYILEGCGCSYLAGRISPTLAPDHDLTSSQMSKTIGLINNKTMLQLDTGSLPIARPDNPLVTHLNPYHGPQGLFVFQGQYNVKPLSVPLATDGLQLCTALIIIDQKNNRHYLAHVDNHVSSAQLIASIEQAGLDLQHSRILIQPGNEARHPPQDTITTIMGSLRALRVDRQPEVLEGPGNNGVTSVNGEVFMAPDCQDYFLNFENCALYPVSG